ncbi:ArsR/SmtB family transcription factor [Flexivirga sp. B27]
MVQHDPAAVFAALGHPLRMRMVTECCRAPRTTSQLQHACGQISLPGTRKHLQVLEDAGLVRRKKVGRTVWCTVVPGAVDPALTYLQQVRDFWTMQLDSMATSLGK